MNYPNGQGQSNVHKRVNKQENTSFSNRGMTLEADINTTNDFYLANDQAIIHKKPTPVQIVKVNYPRRSAAVITEAYFKQASTTDYNGIYRMKHIDFEAKETNYKTRFPLANIHAHQIKHMESVINHGGICFLLIRFKPFDETYFLKAEDLLPFWYRTLEGGRKSIPYKTIKEMGYTVPFHYLKRVDYLQIIDGLYF
ncbi:MAG TPA: Holliday junction resolvase RecU [Virgibacillus sp.]|nr:Holliday junction resolvase RecU [Virgibacillus sp.]